MTTHSSDSSRWGSTGAPSIASTLPGDVSSDARQLSQWSTQVANSIASGAIGESADMTIPERDSTSAEIQRLIEFRVLVDQKPGQSDRPVRRLRLTGPKYTLGSGSQCSVQIPDPRLRSLHAVLTHTMDRRSDVAHGGDGVGESVILVQCEDRSIEVNGRSVDVARLTVGDMLRVGNHRFELLRSFFHQQPAAAAVVSNAVVEDDAVWRQRLRAEIDSWQKRQAEMSTRQRSLEQLQQDLDDRRQKLDRRSEHLDQRRRQIDDSERGYQDQLETAKRRLDESQRQADAASEAVTKMRFQFEALNRQVDELTLQQTHHVKAYGIASGEHERIRDELIAQRDFAINDRSSGEVAKRQAEQRADEIAARLADSQRELDQAQQRIVELDLASETSQRAVTEAERRAEQAEQELETVRSEGQEKLDAAHSQIESTNAQLRNAEAGADEAKSLAAQASEQLAALQSTLQQTVTELNSRNEELAEAQTTIDTLRRQSNELDGVVESARHEVEQLRDLYNSSDARVTQLEETLANQASEISEGATNETNQLRSAMDHLSLQLAHANEQLIELNDENEQLKTKIAELDSVHCDAVAGESMDHDERAEDEIARDESHDSESAISQSLMALSIVEDSLSHRVDDDAAEAVGESLQDDAPEAIDAGPSLDLNEVKQLHDHSSVEDDNPWPTYNESVDESVHQTDSVEEAEVVAASDGDCSFDEQERSDEHMMASQIGDGGEGLVAPDIWPESNGVDADSDSEWHDSPQHDLPQCNDNAEQMEQTPVSTTTEDAVSEQSESVPKWGQAVSWDNSPESISQAHTDDETGADEFDEDAVASDQWDSDEVNQGSDVESSDELNDSLPQGSLASSLIRDLDSSTDQASEFDAQRSDRVDESGPPSDHYGDWDNDGGAVVAEPEASSEAWDESDNSQTFLMTPEMLASANENSDEGSSYENWRDDESTSEEENAFDANAGHAYQSLDQFSDRDSFQSNDSSDDEILSQSADDSGVDEGIDAVEIANASQAAEVEMSSPHADAVSQGESDEDDDSIEAYMNRLLGRVQGHSNSPSSATADSISMSSVSDSHNADDDEQTPELEDVADSVIDETPIVPRSQAPEKNSNLSAMRQLANDSARDAISISTAKQIKQIRMEAIKSFAGAGFCLLIGAIAGSVAGSSALQVVATVMTAIAITICLYQGWTALQESKSRSTA